MERLAVIVLGMHRSGTSTTSGLLDNLGLYTGQSKMGGNESNPKGFFENYRFLYFNESLLHDLGVSWHNTVSLPEKWWEKNEVASRKNELKILIDKEFTENKNLLFKDPRLCILLPFYLSVFLELHILPKFVITLREPGQIVKSLMKRDEFTALKACRIYMDHMLAAEKYTRGYPRIFIGYEEILHDPILAIKKMISNLKLDFVLTTEKELRISDFVDPSLNHAAKINENILCNPETNQLYKHLKELEQNSMSEGDQLILDEMFDRFYKKSSTENTPVVTVLTVADSDAEWLRQTIMSVASQNYPAIEHLVFVNTTDEAIKEIISKYEYLINGCFFSEQKDEDALLKTMIDKAKGTYINFMHSGKIHKDPETMANFALTDKDHQGTIFYGDYLNEVTKHTAIRPEKLLFSFWKKFEFEPGSILFPVSVLKDYKFNPDLSGHIELDLFLWLMSKRVSLKYRPGIQIYSRYGKQSAFLSFREKFRIIMKTSRFTLQRLLMKSSCL